MRVGCVSAGESRMCVGSSGVFRKSPRDNADETRWMTAGGVNESEISLVVPAVDGGVSGKLG